MKNVLMLHGTGGSPNSNWFPWLKHELKDKGYKVWVPQLPHAEKPNMQRYRDFIFKNKEWEFNNESIIIGHSSGALATLYLLQYLPENVQINTAIMVGVFKDDLGRDDLKEVFLDPLDFEKIKKSAKCLVFLHSDNDPHCPLSHAKYISKKTNGKLIIIPNASHFSISAGGKRFRKLPEILTVLQ